MKRTCLDFNEAHLTRVCLNTVLSGARFVAGVTEVLKSSFKVFCSASFCRQITTWIITYNSCFARNEGRGYSC